LMSSVFSAVVYVRVSTREQDEDVQLRAVEGFASRLGVKVLKVYIDRGVSGGKPFRDRPAASQLLSELDQLKPDAIIVFAVDRIGRDMRDTVDTILGLEERGVKVLSVREEWLQTLDLNIRKLILSILSWVAEFERRRIRERQIAAWEAGKRKGRPEVQLPMREIVRRIEQGWTKRAVWRWLVTDRGIKMSYEHYLRRLKKYMRENGIVERRVLEKGSSVGGSKLNP